MCLLSFFFFFLSVQSPAAKAAARQRETRTGDQGAKLSANAGPVGRTAAEADRLHPTAVAGQERSTAEVLCTGGRSVSDWDMGGGGGQSRDGWLCVCVCGGGEGWAPVCLCHNYLLKIHSELYLNKVFLSLRSWAGCFLKHELIPHHVCPGIESCVMTDLNSSHDMMCHNSAV